MPSVSIFTLTRYAVRGWSPSIVTCTRPSDDGVPYSFAKTCSPVVLFSASTLNFISVPLYALPAATRSVAVVALIPDTVSTVHRSSATGVDALPRVADCDDVSRVDSVCRVDVRRVSAACVALQTAVRTPP